MTTLTVSSKGQIVLPADQRRRLGLAAGAQVELHEEPDGVRLQVVRAVAKRDVASLAGMIKAPSRGTPRRLEEFDPAGLTARTAKRSGRR